MTRLHASGNRRLGGKKRQLTPIGKSVSVSFRVRVVRACVRACVRSCAGACERCSSTLEARMARSPPAMVSAFVFLLTVTWVLRCFSWEACYTHGLFDQYCDILVICMGFKLLCSLVVRS